ncbi:MAG TPA: ABC transporter ATP-binding protein [Burkholderiales bacterium]|nr:ABC transporter ATP-binding protein [Burkholderiales bacterium]
MSDSPLLEAEGLCTYYGSSQALFDVGLNAPSRGALAVLGRNGAGKTTLLKTLAGELAPARGRIKFEGRDATRMPAELRARRGMGYVPQEYGVFARLTVKDNLAVGCMSAMDGGRRIDEIVALFPRLGERLGQQAGTLSGGERKMLAISRALLGRPHLLLLDEPTEGVWHEIVDEIAERLQRLAHEIAIVIVEQHVQLALRLSTYCCVMDRGRIALHGTSDEVRDNPELKRLLAP